MICEHVRHSRSHADCEVRDLVADINQECVAGPAAQFPNHGVIAAGEFERYRSSGSETMGANA